MLQTRSPLSPNTRHIQFTLLLPTLQVNAYVLLLLRTAGSYNCATGVGSNRVCSYEV